MAKISNYEDDGDTVEFPYNPQEYQSPLQQHKERITRPYRTIHYSIANRYLKPRSISINGHLSGENKYTIYNKIARRITDGKLKRFYFEGEKFIIFHTGNIDKTKSAPRPNFIDYVAVINCPVPIYQGGTLKEAEYDGSWSDSPTNEGDFYNIIEEIEIQTTGGSSGDTLTIEDNNNNGLELSLRESIGSGTILKIRAIDLETLGGGIITTRSYDARKPNGEIIPTTRMANKETRELIIDQGESIDTFSISGSLGFSKIIFRFRDGYIE